MKTDADAGACSAADRHYMLRALELARRGLFTTDPNPRVGCVLVRDGLLVGEGYHVQAGRAHAEMHALRAAGDRARGATAYVTLEPCAHHGRTGPCCEALIDAGVAQVVAAMQDPNPAVAGLGLARLREAGVGVRVGLLADRAGELNPGFLARMRRGRPWVRVKSAMSVDGRTALANGASFWITGEQARADVHRYRARSACIVTGIGTVLADDPRLTARVEEPVTPALAIVLDSHFRCPPTAQVLAHPGGCLVAGRDDVDERGRARVEALRRAGAQIAHLGAAADGVSLDALLDELGRRQVNEVLVEAGARVSGAWLRAGLADEWLVYMAPHALGQDARALVMLPRLTSMAGRMTFTRRRCETLGADVKFVFVPAAAGDGATADAAI